MHPKSKIQQLNRRRELERRLRFLKQRIPETVIEHHFFQGNTPALPSALRKPPPWVREAAREAWTRGLGAAFAQLTPDDIQTDPRGAVREVIAIHRSLMAYINSPTLDEGLTEIGGAEWAKLKKELLPNVGRTLLKSLKQLDERLDDLLPIATREQLVDYQAREARVTKAVVLHDDSFSSKTMSGKIYYILWFFWPEIEGKRSMTARELHSWLGSSLGVYASDKLVELIYTKLRMSSERAPSRST